jgi:hypothetical protein
MDVPTGPFPEIDCSLSDVPVVAPAPLGETPESELPIVVSMRPQRTRRVTVRIVDRKSGRPNPFFSESEE